MRSSTSEQGCGLRNSSGSDAEFLDDYKTRLQSSMYDLEWAEQEESKLAAYCDEAQKWLEAAQGRPLLPN